MAKKSKLTRNCKCCAGSGTELDPKRVGAKMRDLRMARGLTQQDVAKFMGFSKPYVCDLELGQRNWRPDLIEMYRSAVLAND